MHDQLRMVEYNAQKKKKNGRIQKKFETVGHSRHAYVRHDQSSTHGSYNQATAIKEKNCC